MNILQIDSTSILNEVIKAAQSLTSEDLKVILLAIIALITALLFLLPIILLWSQHKMRMQDKEIAFKEAEAAKDREIERLNKQEKFERENRIAQALEKNSESLRISTISNERLTRYIDERESLCNTHKKLLRNAVEDLDIDEDEIEKLKEVIEANAN